MRTAYECRAYPDPEQAAQLGRAFGCVRPVWNEVLAERHRAYHAEGRRISYKETDAALTSWKKTEELAFLSEVSGVPLHQALRHQHTAFANFFAARARYPRFRSRDGRQSAHFTRSAFRMRDGQLFLAKSSTPMRFVWSWDDDTLAALHPTMVIVSREMDGCWLVTFAVDTDDPEPAPEIGHAVGVKDFAVTSDGEKIAHPRHLERRARNLARYQRMMTRKQKGSKNRRKAKTKVARAHSKVRDARSDFLHRTSTRLDRDISAAKNMLAAGLAVAACGADVRRGELAHAQSATKQETRPVRGGIPRL